MTTQYFYCPLLAFPAVLKCAGICTDGNRENFMALHPDAVILDGYRGDKVVARDLRLIPCGVWEDLELSPRELFAEFCGGEA